MKTLISFRSLLATLVCLPLITAAALAADDWKPVDPAHLALKAPVVEKDADAEAIFWEVYVDDADVDTVLSHYLRIKVFTERGVESQSKVEIPFLSKNRIRDIFGRTIKADGTIIELKKDAIFERMIINASGLKVKAKTFAMPGVEPGAIIEYRWKEVRTDQLANYVRLHFQRSIPVQHVKYYLKPYASANAGMRAMTFNGKNANFVKEKNGFYSTEMTNMPAFREEPRMPPEDQVRTWMLVYYSSDSNPTPEKYWKDLGRQLYEVLKPEMKINDEVRRAATEIVGDASSPEQKLERIFHYCRTKIKNIYHQSSGLTDEERKKLKENKSPADTLKRGQGNSRDIDMLFAALATAAGFDARVAMLSDRSDIFFDPNFPSTYFLRSSDIAVRVGNEWRFFDPSSAYISYGMLRWQQEGLQALVTDPKDPVFVSTPVAPAEKSVIKRTAKLRLSEDGTLEGEVRIEYTGHAGVERKSDNDEDSPAEREETLREIVKRQMSTAELADIRVENVTDPVSPFVYAYRVRVPGYAQRTGKRLFLQPAFFQKGVGTLFPTSARKYSVYFRYPWSEEDTVSIELPAGFALDNAETPAPFGAGSVSQYEVRIGVSKDNRTLHYKRAFSFGGTGTILFPLQTYPQLKQLFDVLHERDNHTITLKQEATASK
jgi:hypothetical protein